MSRWIDEDHNSHTEPEQVGIGSDEKQARLNPRQRYNRWADAKIAELEKKIETQSAEIDRLTDLVNRDGWAPLDMVAGGPGAPGYDEP
jgi:hypothetical protein